MSASPPPPPPGTILDPDAGTLSSLEVLIMLSAAALSVVLGVFVVNFRLAVRFRQLKQIPRARPGFGVSSPLKSDDLMIEAEGSNPGPSNSAAAATAEGGETAMDSDGVSGRFPRSQNGGGPTPLGMRLRQHGHMGFRRKVALALHRAREVRRGLIEALNFQTGYGTSMEARMQQQQQNHGGGGGGRGRGSSSLGAGTERTSLDEADLMEMSDFLSSAGSGDGDDSWQRLSGSAYSDSDDEESFPSADPRYQAMAGKKGAPSGSKSKDSRSGGQIREANRTHAGALASRLAVKGPLTIGGVPLLLDSLHGYGGTPPMRHLQQLSTQLWRRKAANKRRNAERGEERFRSFQPQSLSWPGAEPGALSPTGGHRTGRRHRKRTDMRKWGDGVSPASKAARSGYARTHLKSSVVDSFVLVRNIITVVQPGLAFDAAVHHTVRDFCMALFEVLATAPQPIGSKGILRVPPRPDEGAIVGEDGEIVLHRSTFERYCDWYEMARFGREEFTLVQFAGFDRTFRALCDQLDDVLGWCSVVEEDASPS